MNRPVAILASVATAFATLHPEDRISLPYENQAIDEIAGAMLGIAEEEVPVLHRRLHVKGHGSEP